MAAYHLVDNIVTCGLTACTPGSAPGLTLGNEYGKPLHQSRKWVDGSWVKWVTKMGWVTWVMGR